MANRIRSDQSLYQYVFDTDGHMIFRRCRIVAIKPCRIFEAGKYVSDHENRRITYEEDTTESLHRFYVDENCIDNTLASGQNRKVIVLSEPNDDLARDILVRHLEERLSEYEKLADSMRRQIEQLRDQELQ